jgi:hypothetical protein
MTRALLVAAAMFLAAPSWAQDGGTPFPPQGPGFGGQSFVYVYNNASEPVRFVWCAGTGVRSGMLFPNQFTQVPVALNGNPRVLTSFSINSGALLGNRVVAVNPGYYYAAVDDVPLAPGTPGIGAAPTGPRAGLGAPPMPGVGGAARGSYGGKPERPRGLVPQQQAAESIGKQP